jgi:hypothetical protein
MPTEHVLIESGDRDDAENLSSLVGHPNLQDSVHPNHQFTHEGVSIGQDATVTVSGGKAFIGYHGAANGNQPLQTSTGEDRREGLFVVEKASNEAVDLAQVDGENYLWLDAQIGTGDSPQWVMTDSNTQPAEGSLLIAKYLATDEDGDSVTEDIQHIGYYNRGADVVADSISGGTDEEISLDESSLIDAGHDAVDVPQTVKRTVADFEGGTLNGWSGQLGQWSVVKQTTDDDGNTVNPPDGSYFAFDSGGFNELANISNLDAYPQQGDVITLYVYGDKSDEFIFNGPPNAPDSSPTNCYRLFGNKLQEFDDNSNSTDITGSVTRKSNQWNKIEIEWGLDYQFTLRSYNPSTGTLLNEITGTANNKIAGGGIQFRSENTFTAIDGVSIERRETEARTNTQKGTTQLGNEVVPSGSIQTGPTTSSTNAKRAIYQDAPVDTTATQGTQSKLTLLQSGLNPAMFMERTLDGQGGAYGHQLQAPLGRISKVNNRLDFNYEDKSDVGFSIDSSDQGGTGINAGILDGTTQIYDVNAGDGTTITPDTRPREIGASYHFSDGDGIHNTTIPCPIPVGELGAVRVTFHGVTTNMNESGSKKSSVGVRLVSDGSNSERFENEFGKIPPFKSDFFSDGKISIEADAIADEYRFVSQGDIKDINPVNNIGQFVRPAFVGSDDFNSGGYGEIRIKQITVEPLPEVLQ